MALCKSSSATEQRLEAMKWYFGKRHCRSILFDFTDNGGDFELNTFDYDYTEKKYLVFLSDGVASAPTPAADQTLITVDTSAAADASDVASAVASQLSTDSVEVRTEQTTATLEIQNWFVGEVTAESSTNIPNSTVAIESTGFGGYIGQVGESELTTTTDVVQLLDDAQGTVVQDEIITGYTQEITIPLREMTTQRWKDLVGSVAGNNTTIDSADITGYGTKKLYQSMFTYSGRLVGHPVRLAETDVTEDIVMLLTAPKLNSLNFSGGSVQEAEFVFTSYKDAAAPEEINLLARGDHTKY